MEENVEDL